MSKREFDKPRIGLLGHGRAGQAVARVLSAADDVSLTWIYKRTRPGEVERLSAPAALRCEEEIAISELLELEPVDALIDFSHASTVDAYASMAAECGTCVISAISNYPDAALDMFRNIARRSPVMCSPNVTLGINYLMVASQLLRCIAPFADIEVIEEHFRDKQERSGTAMRIANSLGLDSSKVNSIRVGGIVGHHEVVFGFPFQTVRLVHDSISREAFGTGTLFALRQLWQREPGLYTYEGLVREAMMSALSPAARPLEERIT